MKKYFVKLVAIAIVATGTLAACRKDDGGGDKTGNTSKDTVNILDFTAAEQQKISAIKLKYANIQTTFSGGYFITVPTTTPSYTIGKVKSEVLQAGIDAVNIVRYIAGIAYDVELDAGYSELNQHGAVLLTAINQLTHTPTKPADMDQDFFDKGYQATSSSNISTSNLPSTTVFQYMDDSDASNIDRVGHRRWILNPYMKKTGFGVGAKNYGLLYAFNQARTEVNYDYVTWPSAGVFPTNLAHNSIAWSITVDAKKYGTPDLAKIEVTLKHVNSGKVWTFSRSTSSSTAPRNAYFNIEKSGYGINNCIIFRPEVESSFKYGDGDVFQVTVTGLVEKLTYTVKMFKM